MRTLYYIIYFNKYRLLPCIILFIFLTGCGINNETVILTEPELNIILNERFKGQLAFETTDFVEDFWRVRGNAGFDSSIYRLVEGLEKSGFIDEKSATPADRLTYRIEKRPMALPTWEPVDASLTILGMDSPLLNYAENRNMIVLNSFSTPLEGVEGEIVFINNVSEINEATVKGKIIYAELNPEYLVKTAIENDALGIITYNNPAYLQPKKNTNSIQFRRIAMDTIAKPWAIALSYKANERLKSRLAEGITKVNVKINTNVYPSEELTLVADIKGSKYPEERLVFSAHVQEPGANDNATGVGVALEMAAVSANLIQERKFDPKRTLTFLWGEEITSTRRYVADEKLKGSIKWGISLDMVGENTALTGGSFLIEKMPDPSAVWTRGRDKHSEWGGSPMLLSEMKPHYLNDFVLNRFKARGKETDWEVNVNPFEGGSDHVPFLRADIPGVLFWHFTDQFYHTDNDRIDKVSKATLQNVGIAALNCAYTLVNGEEDTALKIIKELEIAAKDRISEELKQGRLAMEKGEEIDKQLVIIDAWADWYVKAVESTKDLVNDKLTIEEELLKAQSEILKMSSEAKANFQ